MSKDFDKDYRRYKELKDVFQINYKGYDIQHLIAHNVARIVYHQKMPLKKSIFRWFVVPSQKYFKSSFCKDGILISNIYPKRKDHTDFVTLIKDEVESKNPIMDFQYQKQIKFVFSLSNIFSSIIFIFKNFRYFNLKQAVFFGATLTYIKNYLDLLESINGNIKISKYIASNATNIPECIIASFLAKQNIDVYSIQHGIYTLYKSRIAYDIINIENLSNITLLCWGQSTIDQANKFGIDTSNWIITGNPKFKSFKIKAVKQSFKSCIVLLGRYFYDTENLILLKVLSSFSNEQKVKFEIKPHPSLNMKRYGEVIKEYGFEMIGKNILLSDLFASGKYDFAITYNTSAYYDPIMYGIPSLRFSLNENEIFEGLNDRFENVTELENIINWFRTQDNKDLVAQYNKIIEYVFGIQNVDYKKIL